MHMDDHQINSCVQGHVRANTQNTNNITAGGYGKVGRQLDIASFFVVVVHAVSATSCILSLEKMSCVCVSSQTLFLSISVQFC